MKFKLLIINIITILTFSCTNNNSEDQVNTESEINDGSQKATNSECRIFTDGDFTWEGDCSNSYANGSGIIRWSTNNKKYEGTVSSGHLTGNGSVYLNDTLLYIGEFSDGKYSGKGKLYENNQLQYEGSFSDGLKNGNGILYEYGSLKYEGEFQQDKFNGFGIFYYSNGDIYRKGYFVDDQYREESKVNELSDDISRKIVQEVFNGGTRINSKLYSANYNQDKTKIEFIIDLSFNGDIIESNYYDCRVAVRNYYPEVEFIRENSTVDDFRSFQKVLGIAAIGAILSDELDK